MEPDRTRYSFRGLKVQATLHNMQKNTADQFQKLQSLFREGKTLPFLWVFLIAKKHTTNLRATGETGESFTNFELIESNAAALRNSYRHYTTEQPFFSGPTRIPKNTQMHSR